MLVELMARCERIAWKTNCFREVEKMLNSATVAINLANTHRDKPHRVAGAQKTAASQR